MYDAEMPKESQAPLDYLTRAFVSGITAIWR